MKDDLIICTRNRVTDLSHCLATVADQRRLPDRIVICDSSDEQDTARLVERLSSEHPLGDRLTYLTTAPGLPRQRNFGVANCSGDVVHFIDDDVLLEPCYFQQINKLFEEDRAKTIGGVGGLITNLPRHRPYKLLEMVYLDSQRQGAILQSGRNVLVFEADGLVEADWLSGCSMSFRRNVFSSNQFDERLSGYALGEDVEFTYRVRQAHRLVVSGSARLQHLASPVGRLSQEVLMRRELLHRYWRVCEGTGDLNQRAFWISVGGQFAWFAYQTAVRRSRHSARMMFWTFLGMLDIARSRR